MQPIFFNIVGVSVTISIVVILLMLSSSFINGRYTVKWRYFIWLFLAVRLILPVDFGLTSPPIELILQDREIVYSADQKRLSDPAPSEQGGLAANGSAAPEQESAYERTLESYDTEASADGKDAGKTISVSQIATGLYFLGMAMFLIWQFGLYFAFRQSTRRWYRMVSNPLVLETFEKLKLEMGIIKPFRLRICKKILSPMIIGLFRPTLLLPHEGYQKIDLEVIIRHELVHFKRNDLWFKLLLVCANAVHWFNPVIYLMVREANRDIEISCDEES